MFPAPRDAASLSSAELAQILRWYADMGVDLAIGEEPRDRFADSLAELSRPEPAPAPAPPPLIEARQPAEPRPALNRPETPAPRPVAQTAAALSQDAATQSAREAAAGARNLGELRAALAAFEGCALKRMASRLVFADGDPAAKIMLVGEAPGGDEDREGVPFVGRAGKLLDKMLAAIGLDRRQVYIANVIPWRPPGNRTPTPQETTVCEPFIRRQIELANPEILVTLGAPATQTLLRVRDGITRVRGTWFDYPLTEGGRTIRALATLHPAYLLRSPAAKRLAWRDLRALRKAIDATSARDVDGRT